MNIRTNLLRNAVTGASLLTAAAGFFTATPALAATTSPQTYHVMVMTHLCNSSIQSADQFDAMENGLSPVAALAADVLACPTTGLPQDAAVAGTVASPRSTYDFSIMTGAQTKTLQANGMYMPIKVSEADVNMDVNHDGQISSTTALDISHYDIPITASNSDAQIHVDETMAPAGFHFGTLRFTPVVLDGNNDSESLKYLDPSKGHIHLNMVTDKDGMVMLHVYQFANGSTGTGGTGTTTTGTGGGMGTTTGSGHGSSNDAFGQAIRASVQAQIESIRARIISLLNASSSSSMNTMSSMH
jgi:hypothetical protein